MDIQSLLRDLLQPATQREANQRLDKLKKENIDAFISDLVAKITKSSMSGDFKHLASVVLKNLIENPAADSENSESQISLSTIDLICKNVFLIISICDPVDHSLDILTILMRRKYFSSKDLDDFVSKIKNETEEPSPDIEKLSNSLFVVFENFDIEHYGVKLISKLMDIASSLVEKCTLEKSSKSFLKILECLEHYYCLKSLNDFDSDYNAQPFYMAIEKSFESFKALNSSGIYKDNIFEYVSHFDVISKNFECLSCIQDGNLQNIKMDLSEEKVMQLSFSFSKYMLKEFIDSNHLLISRATDGLFFECLNSFINKIEHYFESANDFFESYLDPILDQIVCSSEGYNQIVIPYLTTSLSSCFNTDEDLSEHLKLHSIKDFIVETMTKDSSFYAMLQLKCSIAESDPINSFSLAKKLLITCWMLPNINEENQYDDLLTPLFFDKLRNTINKPSLISMSALSVASCLVRFESIIPDHLIDLCQDLTKVIIKDRKKTDDKDIINTDLSVDIYYIHVLIEYIDNFEYLKPNLIDWLSKDASNIDDSFNSKKISIVLLEQSVKHIENGDEYSSNYILLLRSLGSLSLPEVCQKSPDIVITLCLNSMELLEDYAVSDDSLPEEVLNISSSLSCIEQLLNIVSADDMFALEYEIIELTKFIFECSQELFFTEAFDLLTSFTQSVIHERTASFLDSLMNNVAKKVHFYEFKDVCPLAHNIIENYPQRDENSIEIIKKIFNFVNDVLSEPEKIMRVDYEFTLAIKIIEVMLINISPKFTSSDFEKFAQLLLKLIEEYFVDIRDIITKFNLINNEESESNSKNCWNLFENNLIISFTAFIYATINPDESYENNLQNLSFLVIGKSQMFNDFSSLLNLVIDLGMVSYGQRSDVHAIKIISLTIGKCLQIIKNLQQLSSDTLEKLRKLKILFNEESISTPDETNADQETEEDEDLNQSEMCSNSEPDLVLTNQIIQNYTSKLEKEDLTDSTFQMSLLANQLERLQT